MCTWELQRGLIVETGPSEAEEAEMMGAMEENIRGRAEAEASGRQVLEGGANEPLMLPEGRTEGQKLLEGGTNEQLMLPEGRTAGQKLLPEPEQKKLLPAGEVDEQELIDTLMDNTGQKAPAGIDAEIPKGSVTGEVPQIEGAKDRTAEEIAGAIAQENGISITTQAAQPGVTTSAGVSGSDIIDKKINLEGKAEFELTKYQKKKYARPSGFRKGVRDKTWEMAKNSEGIVLDPLTQRIMDTNQPWDMGHRPGYEFRKHQQSAAQRGISRARFLDEHNDFTHYRPELPSSNRSHRGEDRTANYFGF